MFSKYSVVAIHLYIGTSRYIIKTMYLEKLERFIIWNEGSTYQNLPKILSRNGVLIKIYVRYSLLSKL
jgi:hypothetical protein